MHTYYGTGIVGIVPHILLTEKSIRRFTGTKQSCIIYLKVTETALNYICINSTKNSKIDDWSMRLLILIMVESDKFYKQAKLSFRLTQCHV
jgi:hypothetical protein